MIFVDQGETWKTGSASGRPIKINHETLRTLAGARGPGRPVRLMPFQGRAAASSQRKAERQSHARLDEGDVADGATSGGARTKNLAEKIAALSEKRGRYQAMLGLARAFRKIASEEISLARRHDSAIDRGNVVLENGSIRCGCHKAKHRCERHDHMFGHIRN